MRVAMLCGTMPAAGAYEIALTGISDANKARGYVGIGRVFENYGN